MRNLRSVSIGLIAALGFVAMAQPRHQDHTPAPHSNIVEELVHASNLGAKLDDIAQGVGEGQFSGTVLVAKGDSVLLRKGYGLAHKETERPNVVATVFDTGSLVKSMTSVVILQLASTGQISLEDTLADHFANVPEDKRQISIHQLLTHSAGTPLYHDESGDFEMIDRETAVERIFSTPLRHRPGEMYRYSNSAFTLLGAIIENELDMDWTQAIRARVLDPAGMKWSGFYGEENFRKVGVAHSYEDGVSSGSPLSYPGPYWALIGNGGLVSNAHDIFKYYQALMDGHLLDAESRDLLFRPQISSGRYMPARYPSIDREQTMVSYFGWVWYDLNGRKVIERGGAAQGYSSLLRIEPESDLVIIILSNDLVLTEEGNYLRVPLVEALSDAVRNAKDE